MTPATTMDPERARDTIAAEPPHRLRLDELLRELGANDDKPDATADRTERPATLAVGELVDKAAEAGFGFLIGILALIAIPFVGLSTPFGLAIVLIGAQMMLGRDKPWLPQRARRRALKMTMLDRVLRMLARRTRWLARSTRRRWEVVIRTRLVGLAIVILAVGLALPLPIPGSNLIFLIPILIYAIGLLERDGVWIALAHLWTAVNIALLFVFSSTVVMVLQKIWGWIT